MGTDATRRQRGRRDPRAERTSRTLAVRLAFALIAVGVLAVVAVAPQLDVHPAAAAASSPYSLTVTPTTGLADGDAVDVTVRPPAGGFVLPSIIYICRDDATYATSQDLVPLNGKCPDRPVSSSASGPWPIRAYRDSSAAVSRIRVGTGTVTWGPGAEPSKFSLTCDPTHPCRMVMDVQIGGTHYIESSTVLHFVDSTALQSCGGTADGTPDTVGSDRVLAPWVKLTQAYCTATGQHQPTQAVLTGEGDGQQTFNAGKADLLYSSVGRRFPGHDDEPKRDDVAVPFALNAVVVGVLGGYPNPDPQWPENVPKAYDDVKVTMAELATLFGQGRFAFTADDAAALQERNPQLQGTEVVNPSSGLPFAPAGGEAASWFATSAFDTLAAAQWKTPSLNVQGNPPNVPRGPSDSLAVADPPFAPALFSLYSNRSGLQKLVAANEFLPGNYGPIWILTDLATAALLHIPTVAIQNTNGEFVQPTVAALEAAVPTMAEQADGTLLPTGSAAAPKASSHTSGSDAPGAYPLTFVEHAVVPHEPLLDDNCAPREASQKLLAGWLQYLTGDGQAHLADGLVPLPAAQLAKAKTHLADVGAAAATGACNPVAPPGEVPGGLPPGVDGSPSGGSPSDLSSDFTSTGGGSGGSSGGGSYGSSGGGTGGSGNGGGTSPAAIQAVAGSDLPGFGGGVSTVVGGTLALLALALVGGVGGYLSSRRRSAAAAGAGGAAGGSIGEQPS